MLMNIIFHVKTLKMYHMVGTQLSVSFPMQVYDFKVSSENDK